MRRLVVCALAVVTVVPVLTAMKPAPSPTPAQFTLVDLGTLGGTESGAYSVNDAGQVAGYSTDAAGLGHGFLSWSSATGMVDIGRADDTGFGIDANGGIVGSASNPTDGTTRFLGGFSWTAAAGMTAIGSLGGTREGHGYAVNAVAGIVGSASIAGNTSSHAYLSAGGVMKDLGTLGGQWSQALGINASGVVVGQADTASGTSHAVVWDAAGKHDLGTLGPCGTSPASSHASAVNDVGTVVGSTSTSHLGRSCSTGVAFVYSNGTMTQLPTLPVTSGTSFADASGINHCGEIVGSSLNRATIWRGGVITDLNTVIGSVPNVTLQRAFAVNARGVVVGRGYFGRYPHAFALLPVTPTSC